jgi:glycosyltransferase involved in cell wall biosynthesis
VVVPHGINIEEWLERKQAPRKHIILWNKNRDTDVCSPAPLTQIAKEMKRELFLTTFGGETPNVRSTGAVTFPEMQRMLYDSSIYLATTKETFGVGTLEAMAAGLPVLAWRWGNTPELVEHEVTGYVVDPTDIAESIKGIEYIKANWERMSKAAREKALQYDWHAVCKQYADVYQQAYELKRATREGKVSVIVPCYNYADLVGETIASVKAQTYDNWECIIVNDGSTDHSVDAINEAIGDDHRFKLIDKPNTGVADTRNTGAKASSGSLLMFLDADDRLMPDALANLAPQMIADRGIGVGYGKLTIIGADGTGSGQPGQWPEPFDAKKHYQRQNQIPSCCMIRRDLFFRAGGYRQHTCPAEDAELWARIGLVGGQPTLLTTKIIYEYRAHRNSLSSRVREGGTPEPNWLGWVPGVNGGHMPFASIIPSEKKSHPVRDYDIPALSIITPVGDSHVNLLVDCIESVCGQVDPRWEHIVVDDTTEGNLAELGGIPYRERYPHIKWVRNKKLHNVSAARNAGAEISRARWVCFLDADDYILRDFVSTMVDSALQCTSEGKLFYSDWIMNPEGKVHQAEVWSVQRLMDHALFAVTFVHPKEAWKLVGGFDEDLALWEDWDYTIKLALAGYAGVRIKAPLFAYRYDTGMRREESLANESWLHKQIVTKYAEMIPQKRRG